jgi:hypothetical protein
MLIAVGKSIDDGVLSAKRMGSAALQLHANAAATTRAHSRLGWIVIPAPENDEIRRAGAREPPGSLVENLRAS